MASETAPLGLIGIGRDLGPRARAEIRHGLARLLRFHESLGRFPRAPAAPNATPIVALYAGGALVGCSIGREGRSGGERLQRGFLASAAHAGGSAELAVEASYARACRAVASVDDIEVGREGIALVREHVSPVLLMPQVARDHRADGRGLGALLASKAGLGAADDALARAGGHLVAWTVDAVVARRHDLEERSLEAAKATGATPADYAAAWLARLVGRDGSLPFAIDPRARILQPRGPHHHLRSGFAIDALARHGGHPRAVTRARRWLASEVRRAVAGERIEGWPDDPLAVLAAIATACVAGVGARELLRSLTAGGRLLELRNGSAGPAGWAWHAAQIALALGPHTPRDAWAACLADLDERPFAPWTVLAAAAVGDEAGHRRAAAMLARTIRRERPHIGGAAASSVPETGLTAVAAHALASSREYRQVHANALTFVRDRQLLPGVIPAAVDAHLAIGAFSATPVDDVLRPDIVGHALAALVSR